MQAQAVFHPEFPFHFRYHLARFQPYYFIMKNQDGNLLRPPAPGKAALSPCSPHRPGPFGLSLEVKSLARIIHQILKIKFILLNFLLNNA
jgi:hypothetical protein